MGSEFDPDEKTNYLQYLDANNLYGWAMPQPLPTAGFRWVDIKPDKISKLAKCKSKGYLLEVETFAILKNYTILIMIYPSCMRE